MTEVLQTESAPIPKSPDARADVEAPLCRQSRATGSRRGVWIAAANFVHSTIAALLVGHLTFAGKAFRPSVREQVVSDSCHI